MRDTLSHLFARDHLYEHHRCQGDLIVFDNIALSYKRLHGAPRMLRRVITGVVPGGV
jgi:hypothetical protein